MKAYVGAGASDTPTEVLEMMGQIAGVMSAKGFTLRCAEHSEADRAFIKGSKGRFHSFVPFNVIDESLDNPDGPEYVNSVWAIPSDIDPGSSDATFARSLDPKFLMLPKVEKQWDVVANSLIYGLDRVSVAKMLIVWSTPHDHVYRYITKAVAAGVKVYNLALTKDRAVMQSLIDRGA
jgi:hypothetical protein